MFEIIFTCSAKDSKYFRFPLATDTCVLVSRSQHDEKMTTFFSHNFNEDRWRKAALKNAFSLLGKQRFEQSAAFFLLAGSLKDAIEVQIRKHAVRYL